MKNLRFKPLVLWVLMGLCPPLLGRCGGDVMEDGTESGNPPVVTEQKLTLVATDSGVSVVGSVGAVSPATATVRVMNVTTGEIKDGVVASDGSFSVSIAGSLQDSYSVAIISGDSTTTVVVTSSTGQNSTGQNSGGDAASCVDNESALEQRLSDSFATAQTACTVDADCIEVGWATRAGCYQGCGSSPIALIDADAAAARAEQASADVCAQLTDCDRLSPPCLDLLLVPACVAGTCQLFDPSTASCEDVASRAEQERNEAIDAADLPCQVNEDCTTTFVDVSDCVVSCQIGLAVATGAVSTLETRLAGVEQDLCEPYTARACPPPGRLPCPAPIAPGSSAECVNNHCALVRTLP